jgi:hypothetical protein
MTKQDSTLTLTELQERLNLSIVVSNQTPAQNRYSTSLELMRRVTDLDSAIQALNLKYTYQIMKVAPEKERARQMLGQATVEMLTNLRDELAEHAVIAYNEYKALTNGESGVRLAQGVTNSESSSEAAPRDSSTPQQEGV